MPRTFTGVPGPPKKWPPRAIFPRKFGPLFGNLAPLRNMDLKIE